MAGSESGRGGEQAELMLRRPFGSERREKPFIVTGYGREHAGESSGRCELRRGKYGGMKKESEYITKETKKVVSQY